AIAEVSGIDTPEGAEAAAGQSIVSDLAPAMVTTGRGPQSS
ncbi:MAG: hypothetical protein QOC66_1204, partial [Pseudonocardiales bacterium]|nr:hypothetical protein [Pseudonocardiales bacterium]